MAQSYFSNWRSVGRKALGLVVVAAILALAPACSGELAQKGVGPVVGIFFKTDNELSGFNAKTQGEDIDIVLVVQPITADEGRVGSSDLKPTPMPGVTFGETNIPVSITSQTEVHVPAKISPTLAAGKYDVVFTRTGPAGNPELLTATTQLEIVDNLAGVTVIPHEVEVPVGGSKTFTVSVLPRGEASGRVDLVPFYTSRDFSIAPTSFSVDLVKHSTTPVEHILTVSAGTEPRVDVPFSIRQSGHDVGLGLVSITGVASAADFELVASPSNVVAPFSGFSPPIEFSVISFGHFAGPVTITYPTDLGIEADRPSNFTVNVPADGTAKFTLKFKSFATHSNPVAVDFEATYAATGKKHGAIITVKHPPAGP